MGGGGEWGERRERKEERRDKEEIKEINAKENILLLSESNSLLHLSILIGVLSHAGGIFFYFPKQP